MKKQNIKALLFDLDGTILDTAPDLVAAINKTLQNNGYATRPFPEMRPHAGLGSQSLICHGFGIKAEDPKFSLYKQEFLAIYEDNMTISTTLFPGIETLLHYLDEQQIPWGIVTNKPSWLTQPLLKHFALLDRSRCVVSGDTLEKRKPNPEPLWHACEMMKVQPQTTSYIGDTEIDLRAAKTAGLFAIAALYGYWQKNPPPQLNLADHIVQTPTDLLEWINHTG